MKTGRHYVHHIYLTDSKKWEILSLSIVPENRLIHSSMKSMYFNSSYENEFKMKQNLKSIAFYLHRKDRLSLLNTLKLNVKTTKLVQTRFLDNFPCLGADHCSSIRYKMI